MKVSLPPAVTGTRDTLFVLEVELPVATAERTVEVVTGARVEALDLSGAGRGGSYEVPVGMERLHVPMRVVGEGPGETSVTVSLVSGPGAPEVVQRPLRLDAVAAAATGSAGRMAAIAALVVVVIGAGVVLGPKLFSGTDANVPNVVGFEPAKADQALASAGFVADLKREPAAKPDEVGRVVRQKPSAGAQLAKGGRVEIVVGSDQLIRVQPLVGADAEDAEQAILSARLQPIITYRDVEDPEKVGIVLEQSPAGSSNLAPGQKVELFVGRQREVASAPVEPVEPPPVEPLPVEPIAPPVEPTRPPVKPGEPPVKPPVKPPVEPPVHVPPTLPTDDRTAVPDVRSLDRTLAERKIRDAGLTPMWAFEPASTLREKDTVLRQSIAAGQKVDRETSVLLTVGTEPETPWEPTTPSRPPVEPPVQPPVRPPVEPPVQPPVEPARPPVQPPPVQPPVEPPVEPTAPPERTPVPSPEMAGAVPEVVGVSRLLAESRLRKAGFPYQIAFEMTSDAADGTVLSQEPGPGTRFPAGQGVKIVVARTPPEAELPVPDVRGMDRTRAESALRQAGFLVRVGFAAAPAQDQGRVVGQTPAGGGTAGRRTWVEISVGGGQTAMTQPSSLPGRPAGPADTASIGAAPVSPPGPIRLPPAIPGGSSPAPIPPVRLPSRDAPRTSSVPTVQGSGAREAIAAVLQAGLLPIVEVDRTSRAAAGTVVAQSPESGTAMLPGDLVRMKVSVATDVNERTVDLPAAMGRPIAQARGLYQGTRVGVQVVELDVPGHPFAGTTRVAAQFPVSSVPASQAGTVTLWVIR